MNVTIVNALGRHSKISVGNDVTKSSDVSLPINSDFLNNYDSTLSSKELQIRTLAQEETYLNEKHNDLSRKLNQLRQEEHLLNQEAERLHKLIVARRVPTFDQPSMDNNNNQEPIFPNFSHNNNGFHNNNNNNNHFHTNNNTSNPFQVAINNNNNFGFRNNNNNNNNHGFHSNYPRPHFGDMEEGDEDEELFEI